MENLFVGFVALVGVAALVAALINAGKQLGVVKDGTATSWSLYLNLFFFAVFVALKIFKPEVDISSLDQTAATIASVVVGILGIVVQMGASRVANAALRGAPIIGFSHSV